MLSVSSEDRVTVEEALNHRCVSISTIEWGIYRVSETLLRGKKMIRLWIMGRIFSCGFLSHIQIMGYFSLG